MTKMTNVMALELAITAICNTADIEFEGFGTDEVVEKLTKMKDSFAAKSERTKPAEQVAEDEAFKAAIVDFLSDDRAATVSDMIAGIAILAGKSNQRVTALVRALRLAGVVAKDEIKHKAYFRLV